MNYQLIPKPEIVTQRIRRRRITPLYRFPSVSMFMPFDPKMEKKNKLMFSLSKATDKVVGELRDKYPGEMSVLVIQKLKAIIKNLDFNTHKKSVAIFVSPVFEKVYHLNIDLEEKIIVNESLQIRDIIYSKKQSPQFHILLLSETGGRIYLNDANSSLWILPDKIATGEAQNENFLSQVEHSLDIIFRYDRLPVFVMGNENLVHQFGSITKHTGLVLEYVHGNFEKFSLDDLKKLLKPHITDWQKIKQTILLHQLREAADKNKIVFGLKEVRSALINRRTRLLLVEKGYLYNTYPEDDNVQDDKVARRYNKFSNVKIPIDEIIEKILENGGDVELISDGFLKEYNQMALIKEY